MSLLNSHEVGSAEIVLVFKVRKSRVKGHTSGPKDCPLYLTPHYSSVFKNREKLPSIVLLILLHIYQTVFQGFEKLHFEIIVYSHVSVRNNTVFSGGDILNYCSPMPSTRILT